MCHLPLCPDTLALSHASFVPGPLHIWPLTEGSSRSSEPSYLLSIPQFSVQPSSAPGKKGQRKNVLVLILNNVF